MSHPQPVCVARAESLWASLLLAHVRAGRSGAPEIWTPALSSGCGFLTEVFALALLALTFGPPALLSGWPAPGPGHHGPLFSLPPQHPYSLLDGATTLISKCLMLKLDF